MLPSYLIIFLCVATFVNSHGPLKVYTNITNLEYNSMPKLFHLDDFNSCLDRKSDSLYCFAVLQLSPRDKSNVSTTWKIIEEVISMPRFYRHDLLRHGICIPESCPNIPNEHYGLGNGTVELWQGVSDCHTKSLDHDDLRAEVVEIHCENDQDVYAIDSWDMLYLYCILALVLVVGIGTTFEAWARYKTPEEYERITTSTTMRKLCTAFSLLKNWDRLGSEISTEDGKALAPIQGIRVLNMFFVVTSHTCMLELHGPIANPRFAEDSTLRTLNMFVSNGNMVMQTSFIISAWMLSYGICDAFENRKFNLKAMIQIIVHRFIRLYPLLIIMLGFGATWLRHSGRGPIFNEIVDYEYRNCRNNWLLNLLFINNLYKSEQMCMQQTWYLAVDTQTFILGLFIMMAVIKNPQHAKKIFGSIIFLSICITFIQHYYNAYDILFRSYPEILYSMYMKLPQWHTMFIGTQHHIPCYVQGLACGYYFHKIRKEKKTIVLKKGVYFLLLCYMWIGPIFTILIAAAFYQDGFEASRWFAAFYHAIAKYSFGLPISIAIFTFTFGIGGPMINVINWKPFHVLGRLSFGVYLSHVHILRMNRAINKTLSFITERLLIRWMLGDVMLCYIVATVICLFVEMPTSAVQNIMISFKKEKKNKLKSN